MTKTPEDTIDNLIRRFEDAAHVDDRGIEFWHAREVQFLLNYDSSWQNFLNAIKKAQVACRESGHDVKNHFNDVIKMVEIGSGAERKSDDLKLTRYACYLIAQNADSRKKPVAFAQTYFAIQTRRQELPGKEHRELSKDERRLLLRNEIKIQNKYLASAAKTAGVGTSGDPRQNGIEYAQFQNSGYKGLYDGLDKKNIHKRKGLKKSQEILDHMDSEELAANLFRTTQAESKLKRENIEGKQNANKAHYEVGQEVRGAIEKIGGTMPENLEPAESIKSIEGKISRSQKGLKKPNT